MATAPNQGSASIAVQMHRRISASRRGRLHLLRGAVESVLAGGAPNSGQRSHNRPTLGGHRGEPAVLGAAVAVLVERVQAGDRPRNAANFLTLCM